MRRRLLVAGLVAFLAGATLYVQYRELAHVIPGVGSVAYLQVFEVGTHEATIKGEGVDPWEYRLLSDWGADVSFHAARALGFQHPYVVGFMAFRALQNLAIFALMWLLLRRFGFDECWCALGLGLLAWAMTQSLFNTGLSFNTYGDLAFYLLAAVLILDRRFLWVVPLTVLAALNRETSGLIPVMLLCVGVAERNRRALRAGVAALVAFVVTVAAVRLIVGSAPLFKPFGLSPGWDYVSYNLRSGLTWEYLFRTLTVVPLIALAGWRDWPLYLRAWAVAIVPAWLVIHLGASILAESRLLLVPLAVVFIPGALFALLRPRRRAGFAPSS